VQDSAQARSSEADKRKLHQDALREQMEDNRQRKLHLAEAERKQDEDHIRSSDRYVALSQDFVVMMVS